MIQTITIIGLIVAFLGMVAMAVAPDVPPDNVDDEGAWITPDDYSVQPWTAVLFGIGLVVALTGGVAMGIGDDQDWPSGVVFAWIWVGLVSLVFWGLAIKWLYRKTVEQDQRARERAREEANDKLL
jgi:hypothetical protein